MSINPVKDISAAVTSARAAISARVVTSVAVISVAVTSVKADTSLVTTTPTW